MDMTAELSATAEKGEDTAEGGEEGTAAAEEEEGSEAQKQRDECALVIVEQLVRGATADAAAAAASSAAEGAGRRDEVGGFDIVRESPANPTSHPTRLPASQPHMCTSESPTSGQ